MVVIKALNLRPTKVVILAVLLCNIVAVIIIMEYMWNVSKIDYSKAYDWDIASYLNGPLSQLDKLGYVLEPNNVQFKFINPKNKSGTKQQILDQNVKRYESFFKNKISEPKDVDIEKIRPPHPDKIDEYDRANATIIALVRNSEVISIGTSIRKLENSFNKKFQYPYTFINDQPFSDRFKAKIRKYTKAPVNFVVIPEQLWDKPEHIDTKKEAVNMNKLDKQNTAYAKKASYHNMCRFYSGNFYNVPELQKYKYYWRVEPSVSFYSDLNYDVFKYLELTGKVYGFTLSLYDIQQTVTSLWPETLKFLNEGDNYKYVNENGSFQWLLEHHQNPEKNEATGGYSTCHFWSNFEIGDMDFFRSEAYTKWFEHLDKSGGFYYERWGDAPVHSIGLGLFADKSKIHWFRDIGYLHDPYMNCPNSDLTTGCKVGKFSRWGHLTDQNCLPSWIDYSMDEATQNIY